MLGARRAIAAAIPVAVSVVGVLAGTVLPTAAASAATTAPRPPAAATVHQPAAPATASAATSASLATILKPYAAHIWCSKTDMGGVGQYYRTGKHAGYLHVRFNSPHACTRGASYPDSLWVKLTARHHTATRLYGHVRSGNAGGLALIPNGTEVIIEDRPSSGHTVFYPVHHQTGQMCVHPNDRRCKE